MRKIVTLLFTLFSLQVNSLYALSGGPFDFNYPGGDISGTYQAVMTMRNGSGQMRWAEGPEAQISVFNVSSIFYRGILYFGSTLGMIDMVNKSVTGQTNGSSRGFDTQITQTNNQGGGIFGGNPTQTTQQIISGNLVSGFGTTVETCNTNWSGKITDSTPIIEFEGKGIAYFFGALDQVAINSTNVTNTRTVDQSIVDALANIGAALGGIDGITDLTVDDLIRLLDLASTTGQSNIETRTSTGGEGNVFPDLDINEPIQVYGNRISWGRRAPINPVVDPSLAGAGSGGFLF